MPLQKQNIQVVFDSLDTKIDPRTAVAGKLDTVQNAFQTRPNEWRKRYGVTAEPANIVGGGTLSGGKKLSTFNNELLEATSTNLYSYSPQMQQWQSKGLASFVGVSATPVISSVFSMSVPDMAVLGNLLLIAYEADAAQIHYSVMDLNTGTMLVSDAYIAAGGGSSGQRPRVLALASSFVIVYYTGGNIDARTVSVATPTTISGSTTLKADGTGGFLDIVRSGTSDSFLLAYDSSTAGKKISICSVTSGLVASSTVGNADVPDQCLGWATWNGSDGSEYLCYVGAAVGWKHLTVTIASPPVIAATATIDAGVAAAANVTGYRSAGVTTSYAEIAAASSINTLIRSGTPGGGSSVWKRSVGLAGRVFTTGGMTFIPVAYDSAIQPSYFVLTTSGSVVAKALYGQGGGLTKRTGALPSVPALSSTQVALPALRLTQGFSAGSPGVSFSGLTVWYLTLDFGGSGIGGYRRLGENLHMSGGNPRIYDGLASSEMGFHVIPEALTLTDAGGGGSLSAGAYSYCVVYTFFDGRGQVAFSAPSPAASVTLAAAHKVTVVCPTLRLTEKNNTTTSIAVLIDVYRTTAGGTIYYKITDQSIELKNDPTVDTVTYNDNNADTVITAKLQLYTTGGVLENVPLPPASLCEALPDRLFLAGAENPTQLWVSKQYQEGEAVGFNDAMVITLDTDGGPITALAEMDGALVIFKRSAIYVLSGEGPNDLGQGQYPLPQRLSTKIGSTTPHVAKTSDGLIFKSAKGFYLLSRGRDLLYVGAAVESSNALTVSGQAVTDDLTQARFTTSDGAVLIYDTQIKDAQGLGKWSTATGGSYVSCTLWQNQIVYLASSGVANVEVSGSYNDNGSVITTTLATNFIELAGIAGHARLYEIHVLGEYRSAHQLRVMLFYNDSATSTETFTIDASALSYSGPYQPYRFKCKPKLMDCESVRIQIDDIIASPGDAFRLSGIMLVVGVKQGGARLGTERRMVPS